MMNLTYVKDFLLSFLTGLVVMLIVSLTLGLITPAEWLIFS